MVRKRRVGTGPGRTLLSPRRVPGVLHRSVLVWIFTASAIMVSCGPSRQTVYSDPDVYSRDYYFFGGSVQIQGRGELPDSVVNRDSEKEFLDLVTRRDLCRKEALRNAHTKFLSLTRDDLQDQKEWKLRLSLGARNDWSECLEEAEEIRSFYDSPGSCRVVMLYPCRPQNY